MGVLIGVGAGVMGAAIFMGLADLDLTKSKELKN